MNIVSRKQSNKRVETVNRCKFPIHYKVSLFQGIVPDVMAFSSHIYNSRMSLPRYVEGVNI